MPELTINVSRFCNSHEDILRICNKITEFLKEDDENIIYIDFEHCNFIYPDYALLILCSIKCLKSVGINVDQRVNYISSSKSVEYLKRMNFFKNLDVNLPYQYQRKNTFRLVEIQKYNNDNQIEVLNSIMRVLRNNANIDDDVFASLDYCLNEILDNVLNHSGIEEGWVVAQYFEGMNAIRLIVGDHGMGIHESLKGVYNYDEDQAITKCIEEGVTNGKGQGHGLYATSNFVRLNQGWLSMISGNRKLDVSKKNTKLTDIPFWQGTCVYLRINTNIPVDYKEFTSSNYDYKKQLFEDMFD